MIGSLREAVRQPDHYYWITALLAARGTQRATTVVIALMVSMLGVLPLAMVFSPSGAQGTRDVTIVVAVALIALVIAATWLRGRWPSRRWSVVFVALESIATLAVAAVQHNPSTGMGAAAGFAALAGYVVFFHTLRYLLFVMVPAVAAVLIPFLHQLPQDAVWAWCQAIAVLGVIVIAALGGYAYVYLMGIATPDRDIEPLTGLLNKDAFYEATGALIGSRSRLDDRHLVILVVSLDHFGLLTGSGGLTAGEKARVAVSRALRETTRHNAVVAHVGDSEFLVADCFVTQDSSPLVERIRSSIRSTPMRLSASIGVVSTPMGALASAPPYELLDELIALASTAMSEARRRGGNQAEYTVCERPTAVDEFPGRTEDAG
jgi:diguanylate cyclase (GGDEF)-like protein